MHKYGCIHIIGITNTEKNIDIPSRDVRILCMSVVRTENLASRSDANIEPSKWVLGFQYIGPNITYY